MKKFLFITMLMCLVVSSNCQSETLDQPLLKVGDTWVYRNTIEKGTNGWNQTHDEVSVSRITSSTIYYTSKPNGSSQPAKESISGADWSRVRNVNGKETVVNKPLSFPLSPGKTWEIQYTEQEPNKAYKVETWDNKYTVIGFEMIEVPAGKFNALKIESEGQWTAELAPAQTVVQGAQSVQNSTTMITQVQKTTSSTVTGRTYKAFWYAPDVKSVEEYYNSNGVRSERFTSELESFKMTN
ncbi:MAG: hypothetical protein P4L42_06455 [Desulfocapsaceae bacterium]|nr:hypothetical protein [Desulfocapsaceae bacterium]